MRRHVAAPLAVGVALALVAAPASAKPEPILVNEELVVTEVDASGLPQDATLYSRLVARDYPAGPVRDPSSTSEVEYVDRRGTPQTDGDAVVVDIGGAGQTTVTTRAAFEATIVMWLMIDSSGVSISFADSGSRPRRFNPLSKASALSRIHLMSNTGLPLRSSGLARLQGALISPDL